MKKYASPIKPSPLHHKSTYETTSPKLINQPKLRTNTSKSPKLSKISNNTPKNVKSKIEKQKNNISMKKSRDTTQ